MSELGGSRFSMLKRFVILKTCIMKAIIDMKKSWDNTEEEWNIINYIILPLQPIRLGIQKLSKRDVTTLPLKVS